jgi:sulfur carrier protein
MADLQMTIQLNGEPYEIPAPVSVDALLAQLDIDARRVAVEVNEIVVKKAVYGQTLVRAGDIVEVVNFVGGG